MTLRESLEHARAAIRSRADLAPQADFAHQAKLDAQQLLAIVTGLTYTQMLAHPGRELTEMEGAHLEHLLAARLKATPIQHLRGSQQFYGRDFRVTPEVLIPRPETEDIVTAVLELTPGRNHPLRIADVGTGSGVLAITLALELPRCTVVALDLSPAALLVALDNAALLDTSGALQNRISFLESDLFAAVPLDQRFDIIVSNPPYIPLTDAPTLHPEVRDHEPHLALFGGPDGHSLFRRLLPQAFQHLTPGGTLLMETAGRTSTLDALFQSWQGLHYRRDLQGIERIAAAQRP